jgi:hypothetical protein
MIQAMTVLCISALLPINAEEAKPKESPKGQATRKAAKNTKTKNYIPKDLDEAIESIKRDLNEESLVKIRACKTAQEFMGLAHFGIGMGLRNNWGLWGGSRLAKWFNNNGIFHPDDMSGVILEALWCDLTNNSFSLEQKAAEYQAYWEGQKDPEKLICQTCGGKVEFREMKPRKISPTDHISFKHGYCIKSRDHQWIWDRKSLWRKFTDDEWLKL